MTSAIAAAVLGPDQGYYDEDVTGLDKAHVETRYAEERAKRLRDDADSQFVDISITDKFQAFLDDPWVGETMVPELHVMFPEKRCEVLVLGAGFGGLLYAVRMVQAGIRPQDIRIVDTAGGFGGAWYWNRYPGLVCDIESYCYLPLLEETGYIPRHRYSPGEEIREYANLVATKWGLADQAVLQTKGDEMIWDDKAKEWTVTLTQQRTNEERRSLTVKARAVATVNGVLNWPKLPALPGILDFKGDCFHTARWNYSLTGGSPTDPSLIELANKRVAVVGTGTTAVQCIPQLARWAKHLYIVQRTPTGVDQRGQRETDETWFRQNVAVGPGWQRERTRNFHQHFTTGKPPAVDLVDDSWTKAVGVVAIAGNPAGPKTMDQVPAYIQQLNAIDAPRQHRVRKRVQHIVHDQSVAQSLQAWYPTWCKRPAFHDEYLSTFNQPNVTLLDTQGKGLSSLTSTSIIVNEESFPVDMVIFATGFRSPFAGSPATKANMRVTGLQGLDMASQWAHHGPSTQHGVLDTHFPNLFLCGPWQAAFSPNFLFALDSTATHAAYILAQAKQRAQGRPFAVLPTQDAVQEWAGQVAERAASGAALLGCTPGVFNSEGAVDRAPPEVQAIMARSGLWGAGIEDFVRVLEVWREEGDMAGLEVIT